MNGDQGHQWRRIFAFLPVPYSQHKTAAAAFRQWLQDNKIEFTVSRINLPSFLGYYLRQDNPSWEKPVWDRELAAVVIIDKRYSKSHLIQFIELLREQIHEFYDDNNVPQQTVLVTAHDLTYTTLQAPRTLLLGG
jgi:hypothetical protein